LPERLPIRWRLRGLHEDWQTTENQVVEIGDPAPGKYRFEAQVSHSDKEWDTSVLTIPFVVVAPWWQSPGVRWSLGGSALLALLGVIHGVSRRREARRVAELKYQ